jgi:hypothetical protein
MRWRDKPPGSVDFVLNVLAKMLVNGKQTTIQCSETKVMQFVFNLLRIKGMYMLRALLVHLQEALHKRHLVHCVRVMSVDCTTSILVQPTDITRTQYTKCRLCNAS